MRGKKYDIFNGGIAELAKDLSKLQKEQLPSLQKKVLPLLANEVMIQIKKESLTIVDDNHVIDAVASSNIIETIGDTKLKIKNTSQHATYSEFGTGSVGAYNSPHPNELPSWEHMLNDKRNYASGWRYKLPSGQLVRTHGVPSNPVFWRSSQSVKNRLYEILSKESRKVIK